jgi:hypothetical protein
VPSTREASRKVCDEEAHIGSIHLQTQEQGYFHEAGQVRLLMAQSARRLTARPGKRAPEAEINSIQVPFAALCTKAALFK